MNHITEAHRRKAFALMGEIAKHCGYESKGQFYANVIKPAYNKAYDIDFSLKEGEFDLDEYDRFLEFVLDIGLSVGVEFKNMPQNCFNDTERYLILMIKNRTCCITGEPGADIHHTETVGMGMDRTEVDHSKIPRMALSRIKHQECHRIGQEAFNAKYHVFGVLCEYHNSPEYDNEPTPILAHQNIKTMRHGGKNGLIGVQFKSQVPGCNEKGVIVYRMDADEYSQMMEQPDPMQWFIENVYGQREIVEM